MLAIKEHADHLVATLQSKYTITMDWETKQFCGIDLHWDYQNRTVDLDMPFSTSPTPQLTQSTLHICGWPLTMAKRPN
jgi:hypothetical protein